MKIFLFLIFSFYLLLVSSVKAQVKEYDAFYYEQLAQAKKDRNEGWKTAAVYGSSIILNGIGDGLNDSGKKTAGHICNAISIGELLMSFKILEYDDKWYKYPLSYIGLRVGLFDFAYNATRHLPYNYTGTTSITDKIYNSGNGGQTFVRASALIVSVGFTLNLK